jgi:hypothetical protein
VCRRCVHPVSYRNGLRPEHVCSRLSGSLDLTLASLVSESPHIDAGNGTIRWTRTYAAIDGSRNTYETRPVDFPGISPTILWTDNIQAALQAIGFDFATGVPLSDGRQPFSLVVQCRVQHDYFVFNGDILNDPAQTNGIIQKFRPFLGNFYIDAQAVMDNDFLSVGTFVTLDGTSTIPPASTTTPDKTTYLTWIGTNEICVETSVIRPWRGNIYERITYFAFAQ